MLGTPLQVAATFIILFTIYGAVLDYTGAGKFYVDLAFALTGKRPTGAARTVTVASFLLGTVSGSGVATTVTLGSIAYPMLKKAGHDRESSGAILSAGGIGAVISPPVLGPAAFLMAEILGISYLHVVVMAMMPTILYYLRILVGILLQTGLGLKISRLILDLGLGNLVLRLVVSAIVLWVLGLSLPITATYLVAVPTVVPALITLGVAPPAAHMFVFYYAVLSEVSPPVALSPFAAAAITGGNPYKTMMLTWKYALPCFLVPFMFTQPGGLAILWTGSTIPEAILASVSAAVGIIALVAGVGGYLLRPTSLIERALLIAGGLLLLAPGLGPDVAGLALFGVAGASQLVRRARRPATAAA